MCHCQVVFSAEKNGTTGRDDMHQVVNRLVGHLQVAVALAKHWPGENVFSEPCSTYPRTCKTFSGSRNGGYTVMATQRVAASQKRRSSKTKTKLMYRPGSASVATVLRVASWAGSNFPEKSGVLRTIMSLLTPQT